MPEACPYKWIKPVTWYCRYEKKADWKSALLVAGAGLEPATFGL